MGLLLDGVRMGKHDDWSRTSRHESVPDISSEDSCPSSPRSRSKSDRRGVDVLRGSEGFFDDVRPVSYFGRYPVIRVCEAIADDTEDGVGMFPCGVKWQFVGVFRGLFDDVHDGEVTVERVNVGTNRRASGLGIGLVGDR